MNKKILFVLPLSWAFAGCAAMAVPDAGDCHIQSIIPTVCTGSRNNPKVTFNTQVIKANPPNVCAEPGSTLTISIKPANKQKLGCVAVQPKDDLDTWLTGTNSDDAEKIEIPIPEWVADGDHDYGFTTCDGKCLDPRVNVN